MLGDFRFSSCEMFKEMCIFVSAPLQHHPSRAGVIIGGIFQIFNHYNIWDIKDSEELNPTVFFLVMLPPIIFESGYSLHKVSILN